MNRSQRRWHVVIWLALGPLIVVGLLAALAVRPRIPIERAAPALSMPSSSATRTAAPAAEGGR